jgi:hypothetical protein
VRDYPRALPFKTGKREIRRISFVLRIRRNLAPDFGQEADEWKFVF